MTLLPDDFLERHADITVGLNRHRFTEEAWPVDHLVLTDRGEVASLFSAFRTSLGRINGHFLHWLFSRQMRLGEVVARIERVPDPDRSTIRAMQHAYATQRETPALTLPAYRAEGRMFLMDGNHRATALLLSGRPFSLALDCIAGPLDGEALTDIVHCRD